MKKNLMKSLSVVLVLLMMSVAMIGCGGDKDGTGEDAKKSGGDDVKTLTEEEYIAKVEEFSTKATNLQTEMTAELAKVDQTDVEAVKGVLAKVKSPFEEFAALNAPEKYKAAQAKFKSGCEAMIEYVDIAIEMMSAASDPAADPAAIQEYTTKMTTALQTAMTDMGEGATLAQEADAK